MQLFPHLQWGWNDAYSKKAMNYSLALWTLVYWCCVSKSHFFHFGAGLQITWYQTTLLRSKLSTISLKKKNKTPSTTLETGDYIPKQNRLKIVKHSASKNTSSCKSSEKPSELCSQFSILQNTSSKHSWIYSSDLVIYFFSYGFFSC